MLEDDKYYERTCQNCGSFYQDIDDYDYGICMMDEEFGPYLDDIIENDNFLSCNEVFLRKKIKGLSEACELFDVIEFIDLPEGMDLATYLEIDMLKNSNVDDIIKHLYNDDIKKVKRTLSKLSKYFYLKNTGAFEGILEYYLSLGPAENLEDVHLRMEIIELLRTYESDERIIRAYVSELDRTPSNNTTRQLYSLVLDRLKWCNYDLVSDLLYNLLYTKKYGENLNKRIIDTIENNYTIPKDYMY